VVKPLSVGGLWVGTTGKGLSVFRDGVWKSYGRKQGLLNLWVNDVLATEDGTVWVATGSGLYSGKPGSWRLFGGKGKPPPIETEVSSLVFHNKTLWVGTMLNGMWAIKHGFWIRMPPKELPSPEVLTQAADSEGTLWIGTRRGLVAYHTRAGFRTVPPTSGLPEEEIKILDVDPKGVLRVGTFSGKVYERVVAKSLKQDSEDEGFGAPAPKLGTFKLLFDPEKEASPAPGPVKSGP
jgi:ligand-binding sensor domain-containing protein